VARAISCDAVVAAVRPGTGVGRTGVAVRDNIGVASAVIGGGLVPDVAGGAGASSGGDDGLVPARGNGGVVWVGVGVVVRGSDGCSVGVGVDRRTGAVGSRGVVAGAIDLPSASLRDAARPGDAAAIDLPSASLPDAARPGDAAAIDLPSASLPDAARPGDAAALDLPSASLRDAARPGDAAALGVRSVVAGAIDMRGVAWMTGGSGGVVAGGIDAGPVPRVPGGNDVGRLRNATESVSVSSRASSSPA